MFDEFFEDGEDLIAVATPGCHPEGYEGDATAGAAEDEGVEVFFIADAGWVDAVSGGEGWGGGELAGCVGESYSGS